MSGALEKQEGGDHYKKLKIQPAEYAFHNKLPALEASVVKYVTRHEAKGGAEDLKKAIHCIQLILQLQYEESGEEL